MGEPTPLTAYQQTYHWRNKNCGPWAQEWIRKELPGIRVVDGASWAEIDTVTNVGGDFDLGQRKGKLLTIYDLEVDATWKGQVGEEEIKGKVKIPEVSHEAIDGLSDYVYEFTLTSDSSSSATALLAFVKKALPDVLSAKLNTLRPALLEAHGVADNAGAATGGYSPAPPDKVVVPTKPAVAAAENNKKEQAQVPSEVKKEEPKLGGTKTVEVDAELRASAEDIWALLTEESKIPMWSRSAAQFKLEPGASYSLFGGSVTGKIVSADKPTKLVQTWQPKQPNWPSDHYGTLTLLLDQGSDSTKATFKLDGVPAGAQLDIEKALDAFYIRGLKQMGCVISTCSRSYYPSISTAPATASSTTRTRRHKRKTTNKASSTSIGGQATASQIAGGAAVVGLTAVLVGMVYTSFSR